MFHVCTYDGDGLNFGAIFSLAMRKAKTHKGRSINSGASLLNYVILQVCQKKRSITTLFFRGPYVATHIKGPDMSLGSVLTTVERAYRDELIMACMYGLEMLRHQMAITPPHKKSFKMLRFNTH